MEDESEERSGNEAKDDQERNKEQGTPSGPKALWTKEGPRKGMGSPQKYFWLFNCPAWLFVRHASSPFTLSVRK